MRLSINLLCATGLVTVDHVALLELAVDAGFDGVEIPVLDGTPDHFARLGAILDDLGLERTCTAITPTSERDPTSADESRRAAGCAHLDWIVECAKALRAEVIGGPFHAPIGQFTGAGPTADEWQRGADAHRRMAVAASEHGMRLALEPLNRFETHFLNTAAQARAYCDLVDHPAFGIMYDTFHAHIEEKDSAAAIDTLGPKLHVFHASENDRGIPGTGQIDFPSLFSKARMNGFDGWVVVEAFGSGVPELAAATRIWRPMFDSHAQLFRDSARYVRECWNAA